MNTKELIALYKSVQVSSNLILDQIKKSDDPWQFFAENGLRFEAVSRYRAEYKCGVREAIDIVDAHTLELKVQLLTQMNATDQDAYFKAHSK